MEFYTCEKRSDFFKNFDGSILALYWRNFCKLKRNQNFEIQNWKKKIQKNLLLNVWVKVYVDLLTISTLTMLLLDNFIALIISFNHCFNHVSSNVPTFSGYFFSLYHCNEGYLRKKHFVKNTKPINVFVNFSLLIYFFYKVHL